MTIAFATSSIHFKDFKPLNIVRRTARPLQVTSKSNLDDAPEKVKINYHLYAARRMLQLKNMYSPKTFLPCTFCHGTGFVDCPKCNQGCWKCCHTTLIKCHYCGGTGESTPCLHFMPSNYEEDEPVGDDKHNELLDNNDEETTSYTTEHMIKWKDYDYKFFIY